MNKLNIDEVMALQMMGLPVKKIIETDLEAFDKLYADNPKLKGLVDKANDILDCQGNSGIISISCQDDDFPKRLLAIGEDCAAVIHCKGDVTSAYFELYHLNISYTM